MFSVINPLVKGNTPLALARRDGCLLHPFIRGLILSSRYVQVRRQGEDRLQRESQHLRYLERTGLRGRPFTSLDLRASASPQIVRIPVHLFGGISSSNLD